MSERKKLLEFLEEEIDQSERNKERLMVRIADAEYPDIHSYKSDLDKETGYLTALRTVKGKLLELLEEVAEGC